MAIGDIEYYRKRFSEALDEYDVLNAYVHEEGSPAFQQVEIQHNSLVERLLAEVGI